MIEKEGVKVIEKLPKNVEEIKEKDKEVIDEIEVIVKGLNNPIGTLKLRELSIGKSNVVIIISDITRAFQKLSFYLPYIVDEILLAGVQKENISFLVALGTHRSSTEDEHKFLLGELYGQYKIEDSHCTKSEFKYLGETSYGTSVEINKKALNADLLVVTGSIIHHDMAGFSGGRKSILPGIASEKTINMNHSLAMSDKDAISKFGIRQYVENGNIKDNIISKDMEEACYMVKPEFLFNVIQDGNGKIISTVAGSPITAYIEGCKLVKEYSQINVPTAKDVIWVNCGPYPKDINLYQISKAVSNTKYSVKKGGRIVLIAQCIEGIGAPEMEFMFYNFKNNKEREEELRKAFTIGKYAAYLITTAAEDKEIIVISDVLDKDSLSKVNIKVISSIEQAIVYLEEIYQNGYEAYYLSSSSKVIKLEET